MRLSLYCWWICEEVLSTCRGQNPHRHQGKTKCIYGKAGTRVSLYSALYHQRINTQLNCWLQDMKFQVLAANLLYGMSLAPPGTTDSPLLPTLLFPIHGLPTVIKSALIAAPSPLEKNRSFWNPCFLCKYSKRLKRDFPNMYILSIHPISGDRIPLGIIAGHP